MIAVSCTKGPQLSPQHHNYLGGALWVRLVHIHWPPPHRAHPSLPCTTAPHVRHGSHVLLSIAGAASQGPLLHQGGPNLSENASENVRLLNPLILPDLGLPDGSPPSHFESLPWPCSPRCMCGRSPTGYTRCLCGQSVALSAQQASETPVWRWAPL